MSEVVSRKPALGRSRKNLLVLAAVILCFLGGTATGLVVLAAFGDFPSIESIQAYRPSVTSKIYDRHNRLVGEIFQEKRTLVPYDRIPKHLVDAFVAAEDANFFSHKGVDFSAIARAALKDILSVKFAQGGSTITQQTVKQLFLSSEKSIRRKLKEVILAYRIEKKLSKEEILYLYLNQIYLGDGAYGVEAASRSYFGKGVSEVNLAEGAMLASLPKAPNRYSPRINPELSKQRQRYVLRRMVEAGFLPKNAADRAFLEKITLAPPSTFRSKAAYFLEYIRVYLAEKYGTDALYREGLRIYTTIDAKLQETATDALVSGVQQTEERNRYEDLQGALLALDPHTGAILAMVGGVDFVGSQFNRAIQARRQPGSAFKPIIYAAALDAGKTLASTLYDSPVEFDLGETELWKPRNYDGTFLGPIPLIDALAKSRNLATIRLLNEIGVDPAIRMARRLGIESPIERNLSIALGSSGLTGMELVTAFATFANGGVRPTPYFIREVRDNRGTVLEKTTIRTEPVLSPETAFLTVRGMKEVILSGTGQRARGLGRPLAGKTGTTNENTDAWFVGYSPDLVAGVWVGFDNPKPLGDRQSAAVVALPIWIDFMRRALPLFPERDFPVPPGITFVQVNPATGKSLPPGSQEGVTLPFRLGTVPEEEPARSTGPPKKTGDDLL